MKKILTLSVLCAAGGIVASVVAQPPGETAAGTDATAVTVPDESSSSPDTAPGPAGDRRDGPPGGRRHDGPPPGPLMQALDKDKDGTLSQDEINGSKEALLTLDKDGNGVLADEEVHPKPRPPRQGFGPEGRGRRGPGGPEGGPGDREPGGRRRPGDRGDRGERRPPGPPDNRFPDDRRPEDRGDQEGGDRGRDGREEGFRPGPPKPERMVEEAMSFDSDGDEKLDREELMQFAEEMSRRRGPGRRDGHGPDDGDSEDDGPPEGRRRPGRGDDDRPPGPERPEDDDSEE